jgi:hypothetical protein
MTKPFAVLAASSFTLLANVGPVRAHITPPVVLASDRDAVAGLLGGSTKYLVREVRLSSPEREAVRKRTGWGADDDFYRFYVGRDERGRTVGATVFLNEFTIHGPVRVAVALADDGKVKGAMVVEVSEETYSWVKPLLDRDFIRAYVGLDGHGRFAVSEAKGVPSMQRFYEGVIAGLIQRAAVLYEVTATPSVGH